MSAMNGDPQGGDEGHTKGYTTLMSVGGSPSKLDFMQEWGKTETTTCHDDLYGRCKVPFHIELIFMIVQW